MGKRGDCENENGGSGDGLGSERSSEDHPPPVQEQGAPPNPGTNCQPRAQTGQESRAGVSSVESRGVICVETATAVVVPESAPALSLLSQLPKTATAATTALPTDPGSSDSGTERRAGAANAHQLTMDETEEFVKPIFKDGEIILEVECGQNKALMYLSKLCQGSKGPCIFFQGSWLTPNEFQFVSGRETAKDWKRSIRHHGKSLKLLLSKGILSVHPTVCDCEGCRSGSTLNRCRNGKEKKAPSDKAKAKRAMASLEHHVNGAFKPVEHRSPSGVLVAEPADKPRPPGDVTPKKPAERHCSPLRESKITNVIEEQPVPKRPVETELDDVSKLKNVAPIVDAENASTTPPKRDIQPAEDIKEVSVVPTTPKSEKSAEKSSLEQLKKQPSPAKAECARVSGDFRPKVDQDVKTEPRGEKRKLPSDRPPDRPREDRPVNAVAPTTITTQAPVSNTGKTASEGDSPNRSQPSHKPPVKEVEPIKQYGAEENKAKQVCKERERDKEREKDREKDRDREREREKEKQREREKAAAKSLITMDPLAGSEVPPMRLPDANEAAFSDYMRLLAAGHTHPFMQAPQASMDSLYALRAPEVNPVTSSMLHSLHPCAAMASYPTLVSKDPVLYPTTAGAMPTVAAAPCFAPLHMYPPRMPYSLPSPMIELSRPLGYLPLASGFPYTCSGLGIKRLNPDGTDASALDLSTKRMRLEYGGPDFRYDALAAAYHGIPSSYDYAKYASAALSGKPMFTDDLVRSSPSKEPKRPTPTWSDVYGNKTGGLSQCAAYPDLRPDLPNWNVDDVCQFVSRLDGCNAYGEVELQGAQG